ncbi:aminotransferase class V-fold PLP-dependent enzyme [Prochlorococcus marinus]|uniref:Cysteine desulfurase n=1 Tax=Prochlorococcus marinus XMU1408 TaxID=2213228 RepID=A0A318R5U2_PROMR|nr:SufS family cysteine desulfurase [Prochlorococcus marinus]MBW3041128.1 cysteine desulfurase [Prochlorococcus marinus str. XMU1408]PYE03729.1 cysteine desulfurase [Prochlorococcus marinus XMU1408]
MKHLIDHIAEKSRKDFPLINGDRKNLIYLDHAATSQKPQEVIDTLKKYYSYQNANVHRGAHQLSAIATEEFENARKLTARFINSNNAKEIIFTRNATEAINLVAYSWGNYELQENDEILISLMEHHSNIVPWQIISKQKKCKLIYINIDENGELDIDDFKKKLSNKTKLVSLVHVSNTLGCCNPIEEISHLAHQKGSLVLLDACQSLAHKPVDIKKLGVDFLAGSSHKLCGPTGIGFLWGREEILEKIPPFLGGGEMINEVFKNESTWADLPHKFEAGTPAIGEAIGMGKALNYLQSIGLNEIHNYEKELTRYLFEKLEQIDDVKILGPSPLNQPERGPLATFYFKEIHSNDIAELLDNSNICIRSGHHCCQPLHRFYGIKSTARASLSFISTTSEIDYLTEELQSIISFLKKNS